MNVLSTQKNALEQIALSVNKVAQPCFLKVVVGNGSMKGAIISFIRRAHCSKYYIRNKSAKKKKKKMLDS